MRSLATIQRISNIRPIPNADAIEVADILGWHVVIKKGEFKTGDLCVYCEIDSVLPEREEFDFLKERKYRIKTVKLRGQISQGICFPINILPQKRDGKEYLEEEDVTDILGVTKWEPYSEISETSQRDKFFYPKYIPVWLRRLLTKKFPKLGRFVIKFLPKQQESRISRTWPSYFPKTDETRVQVLGKYLEKYKGTKCYVTEKVDGSSISIFRLDGKLRVCSRNLEIPEDDSKWWQAVRSNKLDLIDEGISIQGELLGPGIQGNKYDLSNYVILVFNGYNIKQHRYLSYEELKLMCSLKSWSMVPLINDNYEISSNIDDIVNYSIGYSEMNNKVQREGIVIRPIKDITDEEYSGKFQGNRISFKAINPNFLLKYGE